MEERRKIVDEIAFCLEREDPTPEWFDKARIQRNLAEKHSAETHVVTSCLIQHGYFIGLPYPLRDPNSIMIDRSYFMNAFFKRYVPDRIIRTVQNACKESADFRSKIRDWLRDLRGDWCPVGIKIQDAPLEWEQILKQEMVSNNNQQLKYLEEVKALINSLKESQIVLPDKMIKENWTSWWEDLCAMDDVKRWLEFGCPENAAVSEKRKYRNLKKANLKELFQEDRLGANLISAVISALLENKPFIIENFLPNLLLIEKATKLSEVSGMDFSISLAIVKNPNALQQRYKAYQEREILNRSFQQALGRHADLEKGITAEVMELLLVNHGIFLPAEGGMV